MDVLQQAKQQLTNICAELNLDQTQPVAVRCLTPDEAIGAEASSEFVIKKGKERVIQADFDGAVGQAFTDQPSDWLGSVNELLQLDLSDTGRRAVFTAGLNAVLRRLGLATDTIHCRNDEPSRCGEKLTGMLYERFGVTQYGLIGLQPAILEAMGDGFGTSRLRIVDLNEDNIGQKCFGVTVWNGEKDLQQLIDWCEVGVATGSSVVNGSINDLLKRFAKADKPLVFFGNTISGVAALLGLPRLCPFGS